MNDTLYERLGGAGGVDRLVDRIVDLHVANEYVRTRWSRLDDEAMARGRAKAKEFFTVGSGGPGEYTGRSMAEAHAGMNINAGEFMSVVDDMMVAMEQLEYPKPVRDEVLAIAYSLKGEIMHK